MGENGAGKTTLGKLLARLYVPEVGSLLGCVVRIIWFAIWVDKRRDERNRKLFNYALSKPDELLRLSLDPYLGIGNLQGVKQMRS